MARVLGVARAALMAWGGASLAAIVALGGIYATGGFAARPSDDGEIPDEADAMRLALLAAPPAPRLPRWRPDEPIFSGSIRRAAEPQSELLDPPTNEPRGGLVELRRRYELSKQVA